MVSDRARYPSLEDTRCGTLLAVGLLAKEGMERSHRMETLSYESIVLYAFDFTHPPKGRGSEVLTASLKIYSLKRRT